MTAHYTWAGRSGSFVSGIRGTSSYVLKEEEREKTYTWVQGVRGDNKKHLDTLVTAR